MLNDLFIDVKFTVWNILSVNEVFKRWAEVKNRHKFWHDPGIERWLVEQIQELQLLELRNISKLPDGKLIRDEIRDREAELKLIRQAEWRWTFNPLNVCCNASQTLNFGIVGIWCSARGSFYHVYQIGP